MKPFIAIISLAMAATSAFAGDFHVTSAHTSAQYQPYPDSILPALSPAPDGYVPFHMEHYGRHGSRWLIDPRNYSVPVEQLGIARRNGHLTPLGEDIYAEVKSLADDSRGRLGELTPLGANQHRRIARRMAANFPTIFTDSTHVDARSTVVIRCILSMLNAVKELNAAIPGATFTTDASEADMHYMNFHDAPKNAIVDSAHRRFFDPYEDLHRNRGQYLTRLIDDPQFAADSIDSRSLFDELFEVALNMPSHPERKPMLERIFSPGEIDDQWRVNNASWFLNGGNSALTRNRSAQVQRHLLRNMIASADTAAASPRLSANLRFGHETMVLSLAVLLELADYGREYNDLATLADHWRAYEVFPMACNLQMVFYRPEINCPSDDILVKFLLNEREMPVSFATPVTGPYYRWTDIRRYMLNKLID